MQKLDHLIIHTNASLAVRYLLNLDVNAIDEKYRKMGISNLIDFKQARRFCSLLNNNHPTQSDQYQKITQEVISLSKVLNDEARQNLLDYLTMSQHIS